MLQPLAARNTYDLTFRSDAARIQGVSCLKGLEGLTVTPYDRSVVVTVLYLNFEVDQGLVARVLSQYGTVSDMRWVTYQAGELKGILNGKRQFRMVLKREIPSFLFIGGSKAHIRYFGQPRTCFKCGERRGTKRCGKCLQVGHDKVECPNKVWCNLCGEEEHVSGSCPTSYSARASAEVGPQYPPHTASRQGNLFLLLVLPPPIPQWNILGLLARVQVPAPHPHWHGQSTMWGTHQRHVPPLHKGCTAPRWDTLPCHAPPAGTCHNVCWDKTWLRVPLVHT
ncbi:Zinc finger CCHC domain-containing protein 3 [Holothuria leucospilota]|uniref:Zinc finger CCHC domain-containing protein 3 n=1 Tax=Holothuria leucospilota TaxID=206669 RepID=A0A9Q0Y9B6_HOLLE|nr:Zinc finger CCHC domain-containing protein 3 [Holothuria leucospilota]